MSPPRAVGVCDQRSRPRWVIRVTYPNGEDAYLRHGSRIGAGPIVQFRDRKTADANIDFIRPGLDDGATVTVVRWRKDLEDPA